MRRVLVIVFTAFALSGCASFSFDAFRSAPPTVPVQLDSVPSAAEARTSTGLSCKTPCTLQVAATDSFSVTFSLPKFQPVTVPVQIIRNPGDFTTPATTTVDPNPIVAELPPAVPPRKSLRRPAKKRAPRAAAAPAAGAAPAANSPFPAPSR